MKFSLTVERCDYLNGARTMRNIKRIAILFLLVTLEPSLASAAQNRQWLSYGPALVELEGKLTIESRYGPPNFGENPKTDAKVSVAVLALTRPVNVYEGQQDFPFNVEVRGIRRIQLLLFDFKGPYNQLIGKRVVVAGSVVHAHTGGHYTQVVMEVGSFKAALKASQDSKEQELPAVTKNNQRRQ